MTAAVAPGAALTHLQAAMARLMARPPAGWQQWESATLASYKKACATYASSGQLYAAHKAAAAVGQYYGLTLDQVLAGDKPRPR